MKPKVSIIIPNYNHAAFLQQRLDSVFNQTFQDFEVILLDDASTDESANLLKANKNHPKVSCVVINTENSRSPFKQWKKGIDLAKGDYIWIAESDDYCALDFLEICLISLNKASGIAYVQSVDVDTEGKKLSNRIDYTATFKPNIWTGDFTLNGIDFISKYLSVKNVIPNASAVVFKKELLSSNCFSTQLLTMKMCGDWLFWIQLASETNITFVNKNLNFFRHHAQVSRNHQNIDKKKRRIFEESVIRNYLKGNESIVNQTANKKMYKKWFKLHAKGDLFKREFYMLHHGFANKLLLAFQFIRFKLKKN
ncbi:glycosyltransferase family 2 protein [Winogradskyella vidalii]|uniref:glycosyltransferase family 2 protein n=1 Tax=Winogradskyella vidalii TaxID=2615024 RepID=UPI0015CE7756|nr:glycosyltransferase family 2 protein [Winogradskyella vidalii]